MGYQAAEPLPECSTCGRPTRRAVWATTGGYCTACAAWTNAAVAVGPEAADAEVAKIKDWNDTVRRIRRAEADEKAARRRARLAVQARRAARQ